jgi:hypothetical protein
MFAQPCWAREGCWGKLVGRGTKSHKGSQRRGFMAPQVTADSGAQMTQILTLYLCWLLN